MFALLAVAAAFVAPFQRFPVQTRSSVTPEPIRVPVSSGWQFHQGQQASASQLAPAALVSLGLLGLLQTFGFPALMTKLQKTGRGGSPLMSVTGTQSRTTASRASKVVAYTEQPTQDMWWGDQEYPPSRVLGIGKDVPSLVFGVSSGICLGLGCWCVAQSNLLNILSGSTVNGWYVFGALLVPYSWGLHVASWIQKQNGK